MAEKGEFYSFDEALKELRLKEEELKRLVSEGEIRAFREGDTMKLRKADVEIGYLHRAFEKDCEQGGWNNAIPYTDRLNYVSPLINNFGYASAVEKLLGIDVTERCKYIRVIMSEISRICDHLTCIGASAASTVVSWPTGTSYLATRRTSTCQPPRRYISW